jgi:hypothetical protein
MCIFWFNPFWKQSQAERWLVSDKATRSLMRSVVSRHFDQSFVLLVVKADKVCDKFRVNHQTRSQLSALPLAIHGFRQGFYEVAQLRIWSPTQKKWPILQSADDPEIGRLILGGGCLYKQPGDRSKKLEISTGNYYFAKLID